ncbi:MerR family transcriptional regulator [Micromonospora sp. NPDC047134]|uniref:MerR family transcriptional regulator n=1 Tax=Micromonospora sp. NPDC047134 TaxID=3154340 RepID=UPI0033D55EEB
MRKGLTIGEFATVTHLSVRTLRRYHESGLLVPATVDPHTNYRYYLPDQIATAQVIHRLRELDVPLVDVRSIITTGDPQQRAELRREWPGASTWSRPEDPHTRAGGRET